MKKLFLSVLSLLAVCSLSAQNEVVDTFNKAADALQTKNYEVAVKAFQEVIDKGAASEDAAVKGCVETAKKYMSNCYYGLGGKAAQAQNFDEAVAQLSKAIEVAELYGNNDGLNKAKGLIGKVYQAQAGAAFNAKDYVKAGEIFAKSYEANPRDAQTANWLAICYCETSQYEKGMEILSKVAANANPKYAAQAEEAKGLIKLYTNNKVASLQLAKDYDGLLAMADALLAQDAANAVALKVRVQAYSDLKNFDKVIELADAAAEAQSEADDKSTIYYLQGVAYNAKELKPQAIAALKRVVAGPSVAAAKASIAELSK